MAALLALLLYGYWLLIGCLFNLLFGVIGTPFYATFFAQPFGQPLLFGTTRPDTRLPLSRAGGQGLYLRPLDDLGRRSEAIDRKKKQKK